MKKSKAQTLETRRRIVEIAATEFRRNGIHCTGLAKLMAPAGLTPGGFYRHFDSKNQLVEEACAAGMKAFVQGAEAAASGSRGKNGLLSIIETYLSTDHKENRAQGCGLAALGSELARCDGTARTAASAGFLKLVDLVAKEICHENAELAKADAVFALSAMVGALTMSRIVTDAELSAAILSNTKKRLVDIGQIPGQKSVLKEA